MLRSRPSKLQSNWLTASRLFYLFSFYDRTQGETILLHFDMSPVTRFPISDDNISSSAIHTSSSAKIFLYQNCLLNKYYGEQTSGKSNKKLDVWLFSGWLFSRVAFFRVLFFRWFFSRVAFFRWLFSGWLFSWCLAEAAILGVFLWKLFGKFHKFPRRTFPLSVR